MFAFANVEREGDMTYSEFRYLWNVREVEKDNVARLRDITNIMTVTKVSVFRALERLEKGGYVQKSKDRKIYLTEKGRGFLKEYEQAIFFLKEKMLQFAGIEEDTAKEEAMRIVCVRTKAEEKSCGRGKSAKENYETE